MNFRKHLKRKRACWAKMARANCKLFGIPFKTFLAWDELPDGYKEGNDCRDVMLYVHHYCHGLLMISPYLKESK